MEELILIINGITKYGLNANLNLDNKEQDLEKHLVSLYAIYFQIESEFDENVYKDFDKSQLPDLRANVSSNFKDFGFYNVALDILDIETEIAQGDAVDDLADIIFDLLEVKWRIENNSLNDGLWNFQSVFQHYIQQHLIDLLNFMKQKSDKNA